MFIQKHKHEVELEEIAASVDKKCLDVVNLKWFQNNIKCDFILHGYISLVIGHQVPITTMFVAL